MSQQVRRDWFGLARFDPGPQHHSASLHLLDSVGSTNDFLLGRGQSAPGRLCSWQGWGWQAGPLTRLQPVRALRDGQIVVAQHQHRGRGRQGRSWFDTGGLHLSWVVQAEPELLSRGFPVWAGLCVAMALKERFDLTISLKWPNDLLMNGRKIGGLLLDVAHRQTRPLAVVGLGLNLASCSAVLPPSLRQRATSIEQQTGRHPGCAEAAGAVLIRFAAEMHRFVREGWEPYRPILEELDWLRGRSVTLDTGRGPVSGRAAGIDDGGALMLETDGAGKLRMLDGEVHLLDVLQNGSSEDQPCKA